MNVEGRLDTVSTDRGGLPTPEVDLRLILNDQSIWTWVSIREGLDEEITLHEETLTEMNLLQVAVRGEGYVEAFQETREREAELGADWEWVFYDDNDQAIFAFIQAKRLDTDSMSYPHLDHWVSGEYQVDLLIASAEEYGYYPLYVFFNYWPRGVPATDGCMVASAYDIRRLVHEGKKSAADVVPLCKPWNAILALQPNGSYAQSAAAFLAGLNAPSPPDLGKPRQVPIEMLDQGETGPPVRPVGLSTRLLLFRGDRALSTIAVQERSRID
jgi:hypothetical protein